MDEALTKAYETDLAEPIRFTTDGGTHYSVTVDQFKRRLSLFESDIASLIRQRDEAVKDNAGLRSRLFQQKLESETGGDHHLQHVIATYKATQERLQKRVAELEESLDEAARKASANASVTRSFILSIDTAHRVIGDLREQVTGITMDRDGARAVVAGLNRDIDSLKKQVADLTATAYKGVNHTICAAEVSGTKNGHSWFVRESIARLERARWYVDKHTKRVIDFINGNYYCEWTVSSYAREPIVVVGPSDEYCLQKLCDYLILKGY
jgi:hypothetical protein